jgi:uncharacterized protein (DUF362 family)
MSITRRQFVHIGAGTCVALIAPRMLGCGGEGGAVSPAPTTTTVFAVLGDSLSELYAMGKQAAIKLGIAGSSMKGATIFIKPNFLTMGISGMANPITGECCKPEIVAGVAEQCLAAGAAKVTIGEGAHATSWDWSEVHLIEGNDVGGATSMLAVVDRLKSQYGDDKVDLVCLNQVELWERIPSSSTDASVADGLMVSKQWHDADHVITCPVMKSHMWATVTLAMKNYVGLVPLKEMGVGMSRCKLHLAYAHATAHGVADCGISGAYVDMHKWRKAQGKQDFAIVDCSIGLEGNGPNLAPIGAGITIDIKERNAAGKYFLLAGDDLAAVDAIGAQLMGFDLAQVKQMLMLDHLGFKSIHDAKLVGASMAELAIKDWVKPTLHSEDEFKAYCST